jgi:hypothetical protein
MITTRAREGRGGGVGVSVIVLDFV